MEHGELSGDQFVGLEEATFKFGGLLHVVVLLETTQLSNENYCGHFMVGWCYSFKFWHFGTCPNLSRREDYSGEEEAPSPKAQNG